MPMFDAQIKITGKHALILQKYCKDKGTDQDVDFVLSNNCGEDKKCYVFDTRIMCYMVAAMLGIDSKRSVEVDSDKGINAVANIFVEVLGRNKDNLDRIYHHMILSENASLSPDVKIKKAFSIVPEENSAQEQHRLENYVRGGLEIIDGLFAPCKTYEDFCNAIIDFYASLGIISDKPSE